MLYTELNIQDMRNWIDRAKSGILDDMAATRRGLDTWGAWDKNGLGRPKPGYPRGSTDIAKINIQTLRHHYYTITAKFDLLDWNISGYLRAAEQGEEALKKDGFLPSEPVL